MTNLDLIIAAIKNRQQVCFEYNKEGKITGLRTGNPHAVFIFTSKKNEKSTKIHIVQTAGVSDSKETNPFPEFRMFDIKDLTNLAILHDNPKFLPYLDKYNPEWDGYKDVIEKI
jgi:hypothetical protein